MSMLVIKVVYGYAAASMSIIFGIIAKKNSLRIIVAVYDEI